MTATAAPVSDDPPWPAGQTVRLTVIRRGGRLAVDIVPAWAGA